MVFRCISTRFRVFRLISFHVMLLCQMAGDKKGKGKMVVQKKKKRTREDHEREQAEAVADAADRQGSLRIRDPQAHSSS